MLKILTIILSELLLLSLFKIRMLTLPCHKINVNKEKSSEKIGILLAPVSKAMLTSYRKYEKLIIVIVPLKLYKKISDFRICFY